MVAPLVRRADIRVSSFVPPLQAAGQQPLRKSLIMKYIFMVFKMWKNLRLTFTKEFRLIQLMNC